MIPATGIRRLIAPFSALVLMTSMHAAMAQEISPSHLQAAREALGAISATEQFDEILPNAARALKAELIQKDPDLEALITKTVDDKAIALAARRSDLENESARVYAKTFSEAELKEISGFYTSAAGKKLLAEGPIVTREVVKAANIWQNGIARDLAQGVGEVLAAQARAAAGQQPEQQPAQ